MSLNFESYRNKSVKEFSIFGYVFSHYSLDFLKKMRCAGISLILGFIWVGLGSVSADSSNEAYLPFSPESFSPKTPEPINIKTSNVKEIKTKPLTLIIGLLEKVFLMNTGNSVEAVLKSSHTSTFAYGGVCEDDFFVYSRQKYFFSHRITGNSGTTVNGKGGEPLTGCVIYYNIRYGTFDEALNHRNGLFEICSRIQVKESANNSAFDLFAPYLKKIRKAGSSVVMPLNQTYAFYNMFPSDVPYYAYPGSFTNETTGKVYYSTTTMIKPILPYRVISISQFIETFGSMENKKKEKLDTSRRQHPAGDRPIVMAKGIQESLIPFGSLPVYPGGI